MIGTEERNRARIRFTVSFIIILLIFGFSFARVYRYNSTVHEDVFTGDRLYGDTADTDKGCSVSAIPRGSTWTKAFDLNNEGITEHNYQAYTYDFTVKNNTSDQISDFTFRLEFDKEVFLMSGWNGALEIHQKSGKGEYVATVPDLREFEAEDYALDTVTFDGEDLIRMKAGDYLIYYPSSNENAMEVPLEPYEGTVPGIILYAPIGEIIDGWVLDLQYQYHRLIFKDTFFWIAVVGLFLWFTSHMIYVITWSQIK